MMINLSLLKQSMISSHDFHGKYFSKTLGASNLSGNKWVSNEREDRGEPTAVV